MSAAPFDAAVIGGGPAGLMAAEVLNAGGARVAVFDAMPSMGRKFLLAGIGGMNITHAEDKTRFIRRYGAHEREIGALLERFDADALRTWVHALGIETFVGSSGRVFPAQMKAAPLLRAWLHRLRERGVTLQPRHRWLGWSDDGALRFATPQGERTQAFDVVVLALGGGSWPRLGSDGSWIDLLRQRGVAVEPLVPANCGFEVEWSAHFRARCAGQPLKSIVASVVDADGSSAVDADGLPWSRKGECIVTADGIEGGIVYSLAAPLRDRIAMHGHAHLQFDLVPDRSLENVVAALQRPRGRNSLGNHLRKQLHVDGAKAALMHEIARARSLQLDDPVALAGLLKALPLELRRTRPLAEAISSAGGVSFDSLTPDLMATALPGVFCAGEMLDWEAPTGGYLLTACFASGFAAGHGALAWQVAKG